jgi:hypothetical protein
LNHILQVSAVQPLDGFRIRATFSDGAVKEIDLSELFGSGRVFESIRRDRQAFAAVRVNPDTGTVEWPGEIDLDPEVLYGRSEPASGVQIARRTLREPVETRGAAAY